MKRILFIIFLCPLFVNAQVITSIAGNDTVGYRGDGGPATSAEFHSIAFLKINDSGDLFISDFGNNVIRKMDAAGIITTFAGNGSAGYSGDGGLATAAQLGATAGVAFDRQGNVYIADWGGCRIRKVNAVGVITTYAGGKGPGYSGDGGPATDAKLYEPTNITFDTYGNLYIADHWNNVIRKVDTTGIISTIAGNGFGAGTGKGSFSGDGGTATAAEFYFPFDVAFDVSGNLYIADEGNERIRKVNSLGIVSTIAGNGAAGYTADNVPATASALSSPTSIAFDRVGNMFIADGNNHRIREVNTLGIITTIAGNGLGGFSGDGGAATAAGIDNPEGIAVDTCGYLYITDVKIRKVFSPFCESAIVHSSSLHVQQIEATTFNIYPNPAISELTITSSNKITSITITNLIGQKVYSNNYHNEEVQVDVSGLPAGMYLIRINGTEVRKFVKE